MTLYAGVKHVKSCNSLKWALEMMQESTIIWNNLVRKSILRQLQKSRIKVLLRSLRDEYSLFGTPENGTWVKKIVEETKLSLQAKKK